MACVLLLLLLPALFDVSTLTITWGKEGTLWIQLVLAIG
jgi:hypothetical protein